VTRLSIGRDSVRQVPVGRWVAPVLSIVGLVVIGFVTLNLLNGQIPFVPRSVSGNNSGAIGGDGLPTVTPAPSNVVVVPPEVITFNGSIVYAKAGNIWVQTGKDAKQLTTGGNDSMPSWSPDGSTVYFIRTIDTSNGRWPAGGVTRDYQLTTPSVMSVKADGGGDPVKVLSGKVGSGNRLWHAWIREPVLSPDGHTLAIVSDRPQPDQSDVVLQFYDLITHKTKVPNLSEAPPLGHQDPTWRNDGKELLYVRNGRSGPRGAAAIWRWNVATQKGSPVTGPGYLEPSYSPDGRFIAATKTSSFGNDIVILDAGSGREILKITNDGASWAPTWSPAGDAVAFLNLKGQIVDLQVARLQGTEPAWAVKDITNLTEISGLDGESRPDWFIPAAELPPASPSPAASSAPGSPTGSQPAPSSSPAQ
jgi:Tol biopolymer transport system component